jgi:hypothetical protein
MELYPPVAFPAFDPSLTLHRRFHRFVAFEPDEATHIIFCGEARNRLDLYALRCDGRDPRSTDIEGVPRSLLASR